MKHYDCKYYLATDVFKGICKLQKCMINADDNACSNFEVADKCKHCLNFSPLGENIGLCMDKYDAYPEMNSSTCNDYKKQLF